MIENHIKCKYCPTIFPKGVYMSMYDHLLTNHAEQAMKMLDSQYVEVAYVPPSQSKHGEEWVRVKKSALNCVEATRSNSK